MNETMNIMYNDEHVQMLAVIVGENWVSISQFSGLPWMLVSVAVQQHQILFQYVNVYSWTSGGGISFSGHHENDVW